MYRASLAIGVLLLTSALMIHDAAAAEKYHGTWPGGRSTSLEIRSTKPLIVRYCFGDDCGLYEPSGSIRSMTLRFPARGNFPGAKLTFRKSGETYKGRYKRKGNTRVFKATFAK